MKALKQWLHRTAYKNRYLFFSVLLIKVICPANSYAADSYPVQALISPNKIYQGDVALIKVFPPQNIQSINCTTDNQSFLFYHDKKDEKGSTSDNH